LILKLEEEIKMSMAGFRSKPCEQCGRYFMDDCNDAFCSSSCERRYENEHMACDGCGEEVGDDNLNEAGYCYDCEEEEDSE
jgi:hypothetical protein